MIPRGPEMLLLVISRSSNVADQASGSGGVGVWFEFSRQFGDGFDTSMIATYVE